MRFSSLAASLTISASLAAGQELDALIEAASRGDRVTTADLTDALIGAGSEAAHLWHQELDLRHEGRKLIFPEDAPVQLDGPTLAHLEALTAEVPRELERRLAQMDLATWLVASRVGLDLMARETGAHDLPRCLLLATPHAECGQQEFRPIGEDFARALTGLLGRSPSAYGSASRSYGSTHAWLNIYLVRGIGATRTPRALQLLPSMLRAVPELDPSLLLTIGNVARYVEVPLTESAAHRVRMFLSSPKLEERRQAAIAVGHLNDYEAVQGLIDLLADQERSVRTNAYWALREITAMTINAEPLRWRFWFEEETSWWAKEAADLLISLNSHDSAEVCHSINECAKRRLFRRQLTPPLLRMLNHSDTTVVRSACSAFFALRATDAALSMVSSLEHEDEGVRKHAHTMLIKLTGLELSADPEVWSAALQAEGGPKPR